MLLCDVRAGGREKVSSIAESMFFRGIESLAEVLHMSKHMKKLISTLLCGAMLLSSMSFSAFAEGTDAAAEVTATAADATAAPEATAADATAAPEATPAATEAPVATQAPAVVPAAEDEYFNEAIGLLSALKIFEGYEDGSIKPESTITRAEMAAVILRTLGNRSLTKYTGMFSDVDASHWAADTIQTAADLGIINGMGDGTFAPDAPVKYEQAIKMAVCALNYGAYADYNGGYPMGYITLAGRSDLQLTKSIGGALGQDATRGTVVKLIYNTVNAPYPTLTGFDAQGPIYSTADDKTLASEKHSVYISKGILTATHTKSIDVGSDLLESQISIDGDVFESTINNADDLVGQYIKAYYYDPTGNGGEETIIYATPVLNKNNTLTIDALKIDAFKDINGAAPKLTYYTATNSKKTAKLVDSPIIVYNNEVLTNEGFARYTNAIKEKNEKITNEDDKIPVPTFDEFITPDVGNVKLGDFDNDGKYDIVFVEKYVTFVVNSASEKKVTFKYDVDGYSNIDMDLEKSQYKINMTRDGEVIKPRHLRENNIMSVMMNAPYMDSTYTGDKKIKAVVTTATLTGKPTSYDQDEDENYITYIDGKEYYVDKNAVEDLADVIGTEATFYLDQFDRIAYVDSASAGKLSGSEKYGWIMNVFEDEGADNLSVKMFTQDGSVVSYELDSTIDYWDKNGHDSKFDTNLNANKKTLLSLKSVSGYETLVSTSHLSGVTIRLCKYKVNSEGLISKLYIATTETDSNKAVTLNSTNQHGAGSVGSLLSGYKMSGNMILFEVPNKESEMTDAASYKTSTVEGTVYLDYENGCGDDIALAEFDDNAPTVVIKYVGTSNEPSNADDYNTADDNSVMIVSKVLQAIDEDDETVYVVKGYIGAGEVEFTTKTTSVLRVLTTEVAQSDKAKFEGKDVWNGKTGADLRDYLKPGDICGVKGGDVFIKMVSIDTVVADMLRNSTAGSTQYYTEIRKSATRDNILGGYVADVSTDNSAIITYKTGAQRELTIDTAITCIEVSANSDGTYTTEFTNDPISVFDLEEGTDSSFGDFLFVRLFKNGAQREAYCIRLVD